MSRHRIEYFVKDAIAIGKFSGKGCLYFLFSPFILTYYFFKFIIVLIKDLFVGIIGVIGLIVGFVNKYKATDDEQDANSEIPIIRAQEPSVLSESGRSEYYIQGDNGNMHNFDNLRTLTSPTPSESPSISLVKLQCPNCGANLEIDSSLKTCFCQYCGTKLLLNNENEHTIHIVDDAELLRAHYDHKARMSQMERESEMTHSKMIKQVLEYEEKRKRKLTIQAGINVIWTLLFGFGLLMAVASPHGGGVFPTVISATQIALVWISFVCKNHQPTSPLGIAVGILAKIAAIIMFVPYINTMTM